ncbi:LysR family transcriptional regulator [Enterococcus sp. RIT-PI-f]|uniref:LysR family transcriptional regulator n=1 Tax=Enterococcus sp. RIT-PI-f TaxID=1690244 RepID=UPI0006B8A350|nr:LysR family transcriptional regulator [Enterococcus sp. RIT-PI-f]KPG71305.1 hypothetical protein AEQ18_03795 [Enterococcus sp. RIT-PI-f]
MNLQQLKYINEISKQGTINGAALNLYVTAPTISVAVKELETELGFRLFDRTAAGMRATQRGAAFIEYAQKILAELTNLEATFLSSEEPEQRFSISSQHYDFASEAFVQLINTSAESRFTYRFLETETKKVIHDVANHMSEIGIIYLSEFNAIPLHEAFRKNQLTFVPLLTFQPHAFLNRYHPLAEKKSLSYHDLQPFPVITFEQSTDSTIHYSEEPMELQSQAKVVIVSDRSSAINVLTGTNSYLIGSGIMSSMLTAQTLVSVPIESLAKHQIGYLLHQSLPPSPTAELFIEKLHQVITSKT